MNIGFVTYYDEHKVEFAGKAGFDCIEAFVDRGSSLDLNTMTPQKLDDINKKMEANRVKFATISTAVNHLASDKTERKANNEFFIKAIKMCKEFGTNIVVTNAFTDRTVNMAENLKVYEDVFSKYAEEAEKAGVLIAIENCPHWVGYPLTIGNMGFSPEMFDYMFESVPSKSIGIEYDPSHLFWQGIDYINMIKRFGDRIYSFHAKDTEILEDELKRYGIIGKQIGKESEWESGWWRYRIPGFGMIDWKKVFNALSEINYKGPIIIEHEDPVFGGTRIEDGFVIDKAEEGLKLGLKFLKQLV